MKQIYKNPYYYSILILLSFQLSCGLLMRGPLGLPEPVSCQNAEIICEKVRNLKYKLDYDPPTDKTERIDLESRLEYLEEQCSIMSSSINLQLVVH